jgi:hypothetical protein
MFLLAKEQKPQVYSMQCRLASAEFRLPLRTALKAIRKEIVVGLRRTVAVPIQIDNKWRMRK